MKAWGVVNGRVLGRHRVSGVERYAREVASRLVALSGGGIEISRPRGPLATKAQVWEQLQLPFVGNKVVYSPANTAPLLARRTVTVVHDLFPLTNPEWYSPSFSRYYQFLIPRVVRSANVVITVSPYSARTLNSVLNVPEDRIKIIPGASHLEGAVAPRQRSSGALRLVSIGTLEPRKNLGILLRAFQAVQDAGVEAELTIIGSSNPNFAPAGGLRPTLAGVRWLGHVDEATLRAELCRADLFVYPSLAEGFGLPVLEAMSQGVPALVSRGTACADLVPAEDPLWVFDPADVDSLVQGIIDWLKLSDHMYATKSQQAIAAARGYSWDRTAEMTLSVLERLRW